ncbi:MAG: cytochrome c1 [Rhodospirillales bacterium]|nr:cytochrome c1 [Rhodospirillales bacterium]
MRALALALLALGLALPALPAAAQGIPPLPHVYWSFQGPFGTIDTAAAQRGYQVYKQVCAACHSMSQFHFRDLAGIGYTPAEIKAIAASVQVPGPPNAQGRRSLVPGKPADAFPSPFPTAAAAKAAFNGVVPPDMSLMANAFQGGPTFIYAILNGFRNPPPGVTVPPGRFYNLYFPTHFIGMPPPLHNGAVTYADGTPATVPQMAHDVATFLYYVANPHADARKRIGVHVVLFLVFLTGLTYALKRKVWSDVEH